MLKKIFYLTAAIGFVLFAAYAAKRSRLVHYLFTKREANSIGINTVNPVIAVFSFKEGAKNMVIENFAHFTVKLHKNWRLGFGKDKLSSVPDSIPVLISIETLGRYLAPLTRNHPIDDIIKGRYDRVFKELCTEIAGRRSNVYFRINPDMEVPVSHYPWQRFGPGYIDAFRHFAEVCKKHAPHVQIVWGPAGYPGALEYYPGDEIVDAASVTLKSDLEQSVNKYPKDYTVAYDLFRRLHRLRFIDRPIFILGSTLVPKDSMNANILHSAEERINQAKEIAYTNDNFKRPTTTYDDLPKKIEIGLYDPNSLLNSEKPVTVEHLFVDFGSLDNGDFEKDFKDVLARGHNVIVTFEPFRLPNGEPDDLNLLQRVTEGKYDNEIKQLYDIILLTQNKIYLRYAHEMEIPITRYPWQSQDPLTYIQSFRYFMTFLDSIPANMKRVWGPAGDRGSLEWWPGNDVVDYISMAIYGLPDKNIEDPYKQESFSTIFYRKSWRMRFIDKPFFITEFGVKGPEEYQYIWLEGAAKVVRENPRVRGINYFNMSDTPKAWGDIPPPDWHISKKSFYRFVELLNYNE